MGRVLRALDDQIVALDTNEWRHLNARVIRGDRELDLTPLDPVLGQGDIARRASGLVLQALAQETYVGRFGQCQDRLLYAESEGDILVVEPRVLLRRIDFHLVCTL